MTALAVDVLAHVAADVGEGPVWDDALEAVVWVDILRGEVRTTRLDGTTALLARLDEHVGAALPAVGGGWLLARRSGFATLSPGGTVTTVADVLGHDPSRRLNDAAVDPAGRAWAGSMAYDARPGAGSLYRLDADGADEVLTGLTIANGLGWSPDGRLMLVVDSPTRTVAGHPAHADGTLGEPRVVVECVGTPGLPDGMAVDAEGGVWVALWDGGAVRRYSPAGDLLAELPLPVSRVTSCCFAGSGGTTLVITTATHGLDAAALAAEPEAGSIFAVDVGVPGLPTPRWAPPGEA